MPTDYTADVAIIGAGPAGTACAIHLGQMGLRNVVLVDRYDFPRDKTCGSGVSPKGIETLKALGVWERVAPEAYWIKSLRLVTRGDREAFLSGGEKAVAIVCCRRKLDAILLEHARLLGTRFVPDFDAERLILDSGNRVAGFTARDGTRVRARYTIVANGAHSTFAVDPRPKRLMQAIMGWWDHVPFTPNCVEMVFDEMVEPCYGWLFPESEDRVNIGICYDDPLHQKNARTVFQRFLDKHYRARLSGAIQAGSWKGHPISYSYRITKLHSPGRLVIGEAGRMTHPATAEGIYQGMHSGMIAAEAAHHAISGSMTEEKAWADYEVRCRRAFRVSFLAAKLWRRAVASPVLDGIVGFGQRPMVKTALGKLMAQM
jgi:geranylgeranyl reductase family protein